MPNLKSPNYAGSVVHKYSSNILVSDRMQNQNSENDSKFMSSNLPEFMTKYRFEGNNEIHNKSQMNNCKIDYSPHIVTAHGSYAKASRANELKQMPNKTRFLAQPSINQKSLADEFGINQKVNLNININYSPTDAQFLSKKADPQNIDSNQSRVEKVIKNFIPKITWAENQSIKHIKRKNRIQRTLQTTVAGRNN